MGWVTPDAPTRAELDACVSCGLCLPHCPTFRLTGDETASPRGRLAAMAAVAEGVVEMDATFEEMMGFCLQCRACEAVCPSLVPFGRAMEGARAEVTAQRPSWRRKVRHLLLGRVLPTRWVIRVVTVAAAVAQRLRLHRLGRGPTNRLAGLRRLPLVPPSTVGRELVGIGKRRGTAARLAGCVTDPWFAAVHEATIGVLRRGGYDVVVPNGQTCCGALAAHDGAAKTARRLAARNTRAFAGVDVIVVDAAGCGAHLKEYRSWAPAGGEVAARTRDITELAAELIAEGILPVVHGDGMVAVQDPCHLRHAQRITEAPRSVIRSAGRTPVEVDRAGLCCGAAGVYTLLRPDTSAELGERKAAQVRASGATVVASANIGCEMQLRSHLGSGFEVRHPIEIYWDAIR